MWIKTLQNIFETCREFGGDVTEEFASLGLTPAMVKQGDALLSMDQVAEFIVIATRRTNRPDFPLLLALRQDLTSASSVLLLNRTASTLGESIQGAVDFGHIDMRAVSWTVENSEYAEKLLFFIDSDGLTPEKHRICAELILAQTYQFLVSILGGPPPLEQVCFAFARGHDTDSFSRYFHAHVDYESEVFGFQFVNGTLDRPLVYSNQEFHNQIHEQLSAPGLQVEAPLDERVRAVVRSLLPTQTLSIERVARSFGCSERTLQRWLKSDCGKTYHKLVEEVRIEYAQQLLAQSNMTITNISLAVGYSNPNNFTRAFKNVFGYSPREWRKRRNVKKSPMFLAAPRP